MTPAGYPVPPIPDLSVVMSDPLDVASPARPAEGGQVPVGPDVAVWIGGSGVFVPDVTGVMVHA